LATEVENKTVYLTLQITIFHFDEGAWDKSFRLIIIDITEHSYISVVYNEFVNIFWAHKTSLTGQCVFMEIHVSSQESE
jgi:hypothetical protein